MSFARRSRPRPRLVRNACNRTGSAVGTERAPGSAHPSSHGRGARADIVLADQRISREHVALWFDGERLTISDLGSKNATLLNDVMVRRERSLQPGDVILVGSKHLAVERRRVRPEAPVSRWTSCGRASTA